MKHEVTDGSQPFLIGHGVGTQNYVCAPVDKLGHVDWTLFTPEATLFSDDDLQLTTHLGIASRLHLLREETWPGEGPHQSW